MSRRQASLSRKLRLDSLKVRRPLTAVLVFVLLLADQCAAGVRTWDAGGNGSSWEDNCNWSGPEDNGVCFGFQPFDGDDVNIPFGAPVISFLEAINSLDVDAGAGIANNGVLTVHNGVVNDGTITVADDGQFAVEAGSLAGSGTVVLADSIGTDAAMTGAPAPLACCVTHAATHTIRGEGTVQGKWINDGLIRAEETSGDSVATLAIGGTMTNNGVIRSSATGSISLESLTLTMGATGQFIADGQSIVLDGATTIVGGSIDAINGAKFVRTAAGGNAVFSGVTINGDLDVLVTNAGVRGVGAGITNNGTITLDNLGVANGEFSMAAGSTLDGAGQLVLNRQNDNVQVTGSFTQGVNHTIRGAGRIRANIVNNGSILAEPKIGGGLLRVVGNTITNNSLLQANDGATLRLEQQVVITQGAAGRVRAADGGRVELRDSATVNGGRLQTAGSGVIVDTSASVLNNVTNEGEFHVQVGSTTRVNTTLINNGTITVNPTGVASFATLEFSSDTVLSGTGTIVLNQTLNGARISSAQSNKDITQEAGHTIRGAGWIANGFFGDGRFINHGHLEGNSSAALLDISTRLSGSGTLKNVRISGFQASHALGDAGAPAAVAVEGVYDFGAGSSLLVDLAGTAPGSGHDQLSSTGPITLSNAATRLEVSLTGGFVPTAGDTFTVVTTTDNLTGVFGTVVLPQHAPNFSIAWKPAQYTATSVILEVLSVTQFTGDYNGDGLVDAADYTVWRDALGSTTSLAADGNGNGVVDNADLGVWAGNYGAASTSVATSQSVPEPAAVLLALLAATAAVRRRGV